MFIFSVGLFRDNVVVRLTPTGPALSVSPASWDYGDIVINTSASKTFTLSNYGIGTLNISGVSVTGQYFAMDAPFSPVDLTIGQTATFSVTYHPESVGDHTGTIVITDNRSTTEIPLTGSSFDPIISTFPWIEDFGTASTDLFPPLNWSRMGGQYPAASGSSTRWIRDEYLNGPVGNNAAKMNIYGSNRYAWLITPPINIPAAGYELSFDLGLTDYANSDPIEDPTDQADDKFIVAMSDSPDMSNPTILREYNNSGSEFVYNEIPNTGINVNLPLPGVSGIKFFAFYGESTASGGDNDLFVDNVTIMDVPRIISFPHILVNLGEALPQIDLNEYFYQELEHSYYVENEGDFTYQISPEGILNLYPPLDWYGTQELLIGADYGINGSYEQILKISILEVEVLAEDFDHAGVPPSGWSINHSGSTDYPWAPLAISGSNYAMQTRVNAGKTANERLLSTAYNLSELKDIEISFDSDLLLYPGGSASLAYSVNNITYNIVATYDSSHQGRQSFLLPALNGKPMVKFRWLYINGSVNIGQDNYWTIDDFAIHGVVADTDAPAPVTAFSLVETGADFATLSWNSSDDIYFERYELYISLDDEVNTEDQLWTVEQDAALAFASTTQTSISELLPATYWAAIRVVDQSANASALSAPIMFYVDVSAPLFSNPIPAGQPQPDWLDTSSVTIGCSIFDDTDLDLSSIQYRVDFNGNGSYDESEGWTSLPARRARLSSRATETVELQIELPLEGICKFEFKASDMNGNIGYSGMNNAEGIADDWQIRLDLTAPETISTFFVQSVLENSINLAWAASQDINFAGYRIFYSTDDTVDETDLCWDQSDDPALAEAGDGYITTGISGLSPATRYYFLLQAIDAFGHIAQYPQIISAMTTSSALPLAPQELSIQISEGIILLDWEDVSQDELGNEIVVSHYEVYYGESPDFVPDVNNMVTVELSELELPGVVEYLNGLFFRVVTVTGSIRQKAR